MALQSHPKEEHRAEDTPDSQPAPGSEYGKPTISEPDDPPEQTINNPETSPGSTTVPIEPLPEPKSMEVHHHTHTARQKWTHYFWEFTMLFLAVTAGFMAENLREHYVEQHRVKEYAKSLINDLKSDTAMVSRIILDMQGFNRRIDTLAAFMTNRDVSSLRNLELFYFANRLNRTRSYTWRRATLDQIKNSGSLRYFRNDSLITQIAAYDAFTRRMEEDYQQDMSIIAKATEQASTIIDFNYPKDFRRSLYREGDSVIVASNVTLPPELPLLTKDTRELKMLLNTYLKARFMITIRSEEELPRLKKDAAKLIEQLKKEYHL